jgi:hypothetical protein
MDATAPGSQRPSILSPTLDLLCVGGLSLLVLVPLLISGRSDLVMVGAGVQAWLLTLVNMPHFMASYRIVYGSRRMILQHKWAAIYVPAILVGYIALAAWQASESRALMLVLTFVASAYLAWHYTGQVWGMMASHAFLEGRPFDKSERLLVRSSLWILLGWHVTWAVYNAVRNQAAVRPAYLVVSVGTLVAFAVGAAGLARMRRRTGAFPPLRAFVAWVSLFVWYAALARDPKALFWVQLAHALQYIAFPVRVELNRASAATEGHATRHMVIYGTVLLGVSLLISSVVPSALMTVVGDVFGEEPGKAAPILLLLFINIHHYFTDGVIWKISNPEVRRELFAHVPRSSNVPSAPREARP